MTQCLFVDEQMGNSTSSSASLFTGSLDEQITQTTNLTTLPGSPTTTAGLQEEQTEQLTTEQTNGYYHYTDSPQNVTQNNIGSNGSQNMTTDDMETTSTFNGDDTTETQTADNELVHENTTTGGLNNSQPLPDSTADFYNATTGGYIINNSRMENETSANDVKAPKDHGNLPSQPFQNTTFQGTSQMPDIVESTASHYSLDVTISNVTNDITNKTTNEVDTNSLDNVTTDFSLTTKDIYYAPASENFSEGSPTAENNTVSNFIVDVNSTTQSVPLQNQFLDATSGGSPETGTTGLTTSSTTEINESPSITGQLTAEPPPWNDTSVGTTAGRVDPGGGSVTSDDQGAPKSDAMAVAIGVIVGLLLVAALIIVFMVIRRRIVHG